MPDQTTRQFARQIWHDTRQKSKRKCVRTY